MVRFVHAADLHLDAAFGGVDASDERVAGALLRSTLDALDAVVATCIERGAEFLVIAGDLHNRADRSLRAELAFQRAMRRLDAVGIGAFVALGNHDPAEGWSAGLELPPSVVVFSHREVERREVLRDGELRCAVYGRSFPRRVVTDNLARGFVRRPEDPLAVAVLHANVGQRPGWDNYAPCSVDDLRAAGMDYWALGHVHVPGPISERPPVVYSGSTQGLDPSEDGPRGCFLVELDENGARLEFVETAAVLWRRVAVDLAPVSTIEAARDAVLAACEGVRRWSGGRPVVARLELGGRSPVHAELRRPGVLADLTVDLREAQLGAEPWIWIDRLRDATRPAEDIERLGREDGLLGDLVRLAASWTAEPELADSIVGETLAQVRGQLGLQEELEAGPAAIVERARDLCLDLLGGEAE
jgi:DNA repair exonuclease SbcCD nuclease subunit